MKKMIAAILPIILLLSLSSTNVAVADTAGPPITVGANPHHAAFDSKDNYVYVTNGGDSTVSVVDLVTNTVVRTVPVGAGPMGIDFDSSNNYVYVADLNGNKVSVIDGDPFHVGLYDTVVATIPVGPQPWGVAFDSANGMVYVANSGNNTVSAINTATNMVVGSQIPVGTHPSFLAYDSANGDIYVANENSGTVTVIDPTTNTVAGSPIAVGGFPRGIVFDSANGDIYVGSPLSVISGTSVVTTITGTLGDNDLAYDSFNGGIYVVDGGTHSVMAINGATNSIAFSVPLNEAPFGLGYDPLHHVIVAVVQSAGNIIPVSTTPFPTITIDSASNPTPKWGTQSTTVSGSTTGADGDTVTVHWGDGTPDNAGIPITPIVGTWTTSPSSHTYASAGSKFVTADLVNGGVVTATSSAFTITVQKHDTTLTLDSITNLKWSFPYTGGSAVTGTLTDNDASGAGISGATINISNSPGITTLSSTATTSGATGTYSDTGSAPPGPSGAQTLSATYAGDGSYNAAPVVITGPNANEQSYNTKNHDTTLTLASIAGLKWSFPYTGGSAVTGTLVDADAASTVPPIANTISSATIAISGSGLGTLSATATTDSTGTYSDTGSAPAAPAGAKTLNADYAGLTPAANTYNAATTQTQSYNTKNHDTTLTLASIAGLKWSFPYTGGSAVTGTLVDADAASTVPPIANTISSATIAISGSGLGTLSATATTDSTGTYSDTGSAPAAPAGAKTLNADYAGLTPAANTYNAATTATDTYSTTKHVTTISLNPIASPFVNNPYSVNGQLNDTDAGGTVPPIASGVSGKTITFATSGSVSFSVPNTMTNGVTFADSSNLQVNSFGTGSGTVNVLRLNPGATITLPSKPAYVTLFLADMGGNTVTIKVNYADGSSNTFTSNPIGVGVVSEVGLTSPSNVGISQILITGTSAGQAGISEVQTLDSILGLILDITFTPGSYTNTLSFNQGGYFTVAPAISTETTGLSVTAQFASDDSYFAAGPPSLPSSSSQIFDVHASTSLGVGGPELTTSPSGILISTSSCPTGDSRDVDNLCKTWKSSGSGIPYQYNTYNPGPLGSTKFYKLRNSIVGDFDVYYQIDAMTGYTPNTASIADVNNTFNGQVTNGHTVHMYYQTGELGLTPVTSLHVWHGIGGVSSQTDFDSIKAYHFGTAAEHPTIGGTGQTQTFASSGSSTLAAQLSPTTQQLRIAGISITTPSNSDTSDVTEGTLIVRVNLTSSTVPTITVPLVADSGGNVGGNLKIGTPTVSQSVKTGYTLLTVNVPFDSTVANSALDFGTITVTLPLSSFTGTLSASTAIISPTYQTTLLNAKAQAYRFALFVNGIDGGASGISQITGNKLAVALGASAFANSPPSENEQAGTFMHEVGHNLGLNHGGPVNTAGATVNCKPNYESVMSYSRQLPTYLGDPRVTSSGHWSLDYSHGYLNSSGNGLTETSLTDTNGVLRSSSASSQPYFVWGTPNYKHSNGGYYFVNQSAASSNPTPPNIDWKGNGYSSTTVSAPISGFSDSSAHPITGCNEITAGAQNSNAAYYDRNDWNGLNGNFQTGFGVTITGTSGSTGGGKSSSATIFTGNTDIDSPSHKDLDKKLRLVIDSSNAEYPGLIPPPNPDGSTTFKSGSALPLKYQYFVAHTPLNKIQITTTTQFNFISYAYQYASLRIYYCTDSVCKNTVDLLNIPATGTTTGNAFALIATDPTDKYFQYNWKIPKVTKCTIIYIDIIDTSASAKPLSAMLGSTFYDAGGNLVTMKGTLLP